MWASGYLTKLADVVTAGPFALCRNPLYIGSFLISLGYFLMCSHIYIWIIGVALFWMFHGGAVSYEEKLLKEKFGEPYSNYCKYVPRFIPKIRSLAGNGSFSYQQLMLNNEYRSAVGALIVTVLFGLRAYLEFG